MVTLRQRANVIVLLLAFVVHLVSITHLTAAPVPAKSARRIRRPTAQKLCKKRIGNPIISPLAKTGHCSVPNLVAAVPAFPANLQAAPAERIVAADVSFSPASRYLLFRSLLL